MSAAPVSSEPVSGGPVLLVRAAGGEDRDAEALRALGIEVIEDPYLVVAPCADHDAPAREIGRAHV
jgi:uroporphyrinogen-III synthase